MRLVGFTMDAFVCVPSFRVYFCCIRSFSAMAAIILFLGGKFFNAFVFGFVVRLNICWWLGEKISCKTCCGQVLSKIFQLGQKRISLSNHRLH